MNTGAQIFHVFAKDLRRFWALPVVLGVGLAVDAAMDPGTPTYIDGFVGRMMGGIGLRGALLGLITVVFTALVVQEDETATGQAFWNSRPFSRLAMFGAKALFLGLLLVALPMAFQAYAVVTFGTTEGLLPILAESAMFQVATVAIVMALASTTKDLKATVLLGVGGYVALSLLTSLISVRTPFTFDLVASRTFAGKAWWMVGGLGLATFQFLTGKTRLTMGGLAAVLAVSAGISANFPYDLRPDEQATVALADAPADVMSIADFQFAPSVRGTRAGALDGMDAVITTGDHDYALVPRMRTVELVLDPEREQVGYGSPARQYSPIRRYAPRLPGYTWLDSPDEWAQFDVRFLLARPGAMASAIEAVEAVEIRAEWDALERKVVGRMPLDVGAELIDGRDRVRIASADFGLGMVEIVVEHTWVGSSLERQGFRDRSRLRYVMVNDARKEFLPISSGSNTTNQQPLVLGGPKAYQQRETLRYRLGALSFESGGIALEESELTLEWFEGASLMVFENPYVGTFPASVRVDRETPHFASLLLDEARRLVTR